MERSDITELSEQYRDALEDEVAAKRRLAIQEADMERIRAMVLFAAYAEGAIKGKNSDAREPQERVALAGDSDFVEAEDAVSVVARQAAQTEVNRKVMDARIGLIRAWLYSQSGPR